MPWDEKLHPRAPDGEFIGGGGADWVQKLSDSIDAANFDSRFDAARKNITYQSQIHLFGGLPHEGPYRPEKMDDQRPGKPFAPYYVDTTTGHIEHRKVPVADLDTLAQAKIDYWSHYSHINAPLRGQQPSPSGIGHQPLLSHEAGVAALDAAMAGSAAQTDVGVFRVVPAALVDQLGDEWTDAGFISAAGQERHIAFMAKQVDKPVLLRILAPAGTHAIELHYNEILMDRGLRFRKISESPKQKLGGRTVRVINIQVVPA